MKKYLFFILLTTYLTGAVYLPFQGKDITTLIDKKPYNNDYTKILQKLFKEGERSIYLPPGEYRINNLTIPQNTIIFGSGDSTIVTPIEKNTPIFNQKNVSRWQITDMKLISLKPTTESENKLISITDGRLEFFKVKKFRQIILKEKFYGASPKKNNYYGLINLENTHSFNLTNLSIKNAKVGISYFFTEKSNDSGFLNRIKIKNCDIGIFAFNDKPEFNASIVSCEFENNKLGFATVGEGFFLVSRSKFIRNSTAFAYFTKGTESAQSIVSDNIFLKNVDFDVRSDGASQGFQFTSNEFDSEGFLIRDNIGFMLINNIVNVAILNLGFNLSPALIKGNLFISYPQITIYNPKNTILKLNPPQINKKEKRTGKSGYLIIRS